MARETVTLTIDDLSDFARKLGRALAAETAGPPGHLRLLGHLARAAGFENYQHLRAARPDVPPAMITTAATVAEEAVNRRRVERALRCFDGEGRMIRWPRQTAVQGLCLWAAWARLPARRDMTEREVNDVLKAANGIGDHVLLRRSLIDHRLARREIDGSSYRRIEQAPSAEARVFLRELAQRPSN